MNKLFKICLVLALVFVVLSKIEARAQFVDDGPKPQWLRKLPKPSNTSYLFRTFRLDGHNLQNARKLLPAAASTYIEREYNISGTTIETFNLHNTYVNGKKQSVQVENIQDSVRTEGSAVAVQLAIIDEYVSEDGIWFLCTMSEPGNGNTDYDNMEITTQYGARGLWRSAIVPGWGQFYKGSYLKGGLILGGTAALVGGIVATETIKSDYVRKIGETHNANQKRLYAKRVDQFSTTRNICIGALGALYIYNLIDAIASPGARRVVVKERKSSGGQSGYSYSFYPTSPDGRSIAMAFNLTF